MRNVKIPGGVDNVGAGQGYVGVSVLYTSENVEVGDKVMEVPVWKVVYELDVHEKQALIEGGRLVLTVIGKPPILPHRMEVSST